MEQGLTYKPSVAIIGAGPAGCMCGITIANDCDVTLFDLSEPLLTLLPTGGGRCNLAHNEFDFKELANAYPRGEKFLYSPFSRFSTKDTLEFFERIGVKTYTQEDGRIFPISNSAKDVRNKMLAKLDKAKFLKEKVLDVQKVDEKFYVRTINNKYIYDYVVVAIGTHYGLQFLNKLPHKLIELKPSLCGLITKYDVSTLKGVVLKDIILRYKKIALEGDMLFTNNGISGPVVFKLSSINSRINFPYSVKIQIIKDLKNFERRLEEAGDKALHNVVSEFVPKSFTKFLLNYLKIDENIKVKSLNTNTKVLLLETVKGLELEVVSTRKGGETVFSGGVDLGKIDSNFKSKLVDKLYFCGEILDVDGLCGGYNLQNCWSSGYLAGVDILKTM